MTPAHALILAAGLGTRLRPLTDLRAKPAMPVGGEPLIRRIVRWLVSQGVTNLVVNLHHRPESVTAVLGDGSDLGARVRYSWEQPQVLGSAGGPRKALPILDADAFFVINGDTLTDVDLGALAERHQQSAALVTMAVVPNREYLRYGGVLVDGSGGVTGFARRGKESEDSWHFVGVQLASRSVFAALAEDRPVNTVGDLYDQLIHTPGAVATFQCDRPFWDIGTPADYLRMSLAFTTGGGESGRRTAVDPSASVTECILWDDVEVGAGASLQRCIVGDGVRIEAGAVHTSSILMQRDGLLSITPLEP
jgi:NDP-sugar pyrophosphorylase family protein